MTFPGKTFAGRHSTSHLHNAGLPQFVAIDLADYAALAIRWSQQRKELAEIRSTLRPQMTKSPLCNASRFAKNLLDLFEAAEPR